MPFICAIRSCASSSTAAGDCSSRTKSSRAKKLTPETMSSLALMCWMLNVIADTGGHLAFKAAANVADNIHGFERWRTMFKDKWIWIGVILFICEFVIWIAFL